MRASQRHKLEIHDLADASVTYPDSDTVTFDGVFVPGLAFTVSVTGDVSGPLSADGKLVDATAAGAAAAVAAALDAVTGVNAVATLGSVDITAQAPNATVAFGDVIFHRN